VVIDLKIELNIKGDMEGEFDNYRDFKANRLTFEEALEKFVKLWQDIDFQTTKTEFLNILLDASEKIEGETSLELRLIRKGTPKILHIHRL